MKIYSDYTIERRDIIKNREREREKGYNVRMSECVKIRFSIRSMCEQKKKKDPLSLRIYSIDHRSGPT